MNKMKNTLLIVLAFIGGAFVSIFTTFALAHGGDTNLVHSCVRNTLLPNAANIRIIGENANCNSNETALDWPKTAGSSTSSNTVVCSACTERDLLVRANASTLLSINLDLAVIMNATLQNKDFSGSSFINAIVSGGILDGAILSNTDFTNANLTSTNFIGANFTNANLSGADLHGVNLTGADMTNANLTDVIYFQTFCPDGTNTDENGGTCTGHLTP